MEINKRLKARLIEVYGTQEDAAADMRIHPSELSHVLRGRRAPSPRILKAFQKVFGDEALRLLDVDKATEAGQVTAAN